MPRWTKTLLERFEDKYIPEPNSGCWIWIGARTKAGYGSFWVGPHRAYAHVISYVLAKGAIPFSLDIDHKCRVRCCVNPDHLEAVTRRENLMRGDRRTKTTHCLRGHPLSGDNLVPNAKNRMCRICIRQHQREYQRRKRHGRVL